MDATLSEDALHEELLSGDPTKQVCLRLTHTFFFFPVPPPLQSSHVHTHTQVEAIQKIIRLADEGTPINVNWPLFLTVCFPFFPTLLSFQQTNTQHARTPPHRHA